MTRASDSRRKRKLAVLAVLAVVALAGCTAGPLGPDSVNGDALSQNAKYDWNTSANASINVMGGEYEAVYNVSARDGGTDESPPTFSIHRRDDIGRDHPLSVEALKFKYSDDAGKNASKVVRIGADSVTNHRKKTVITLPANTGQLAFRASADGKQFSTPTFVSGSYEVTLPKGMRVGFGPLARVSPGGYGKHIHNGRVTLSWGNAHGRSVVVRYYLGRDLWIFAAGALVLVVVALGGVLYYRRQLRDLERKREDAGLDVESGGDGSS